jgi:hypothetical protein
MRLKTGRMAAKKCLIMSEKRLIIVVDMCYNISRSIPAWYSETAASNNAAAGHEPFYFE